MSNKKRRNREKQPETISLGLNESKFNQTTVSESSEYNESGESNNSKSGLFAYLKNPSNFWIVGLIALFALGALGAGLKYLDESAKQEKASGSQNQSFLSKINPFAANPLLSPTPQLSKEYIYAGSRVIAVEDVNASAPTPSDIAIWRPSTGVWWVMGPGGTIQASQSWGNYSAFADKPAEGDYDGDGKTDFCVYRPGTNTWWIMKSSDNSSYAVSIGTSGGTPAPADYDGDSKTDIATYNSTTGVWYIQYSSNGIIGTPSLGTSTEFIPTPADFDGDGKADIAVRSTVSGTFYMIKTANNPYQQYNSVSFGQGSDKPVCADYDGDGKADIAVWGGATWSILQSSNNQTVQYQWGNTAWDKPVQNDYDGDGRVDIAVWRGTESVQNAGDVGKWFIRNSSTGQSRVEQWGVAGDTPVPAFYRR